jgi:3-oxoacyl-[acyl-carrier protein] reductase
MKFRIGLENRTAIVTGSASGIGKASALMLAGEGARVVVADVDLDAAGKVAREIEGLGGRAVALHADVRRSESVREMVEQATRAFEKIDILVNNAGAAFGAKLLDTSEEDFDSTIDLCLKSAFLCTRGVLPGMMERKWGRIINIASVAGEVVSILGPATYSSAKAGLLGFTRHCAQEVARHGITVNAVSPGATLTPVVLRALERNPGLRDRMEDRVPMKRLAQPEEQAAAVVFLASEAASYVTGICLGVNGGWPLKML